jgi:hypothetical protein
LGLLVTIGLMVSLSPVVYQSIERIEMVLVSVILVFLLFAIFIATEPSVWAGVITKPPKGTVGKGRQIRGKRKQKEPGLPSSQHNCMSKSSARGVKTLGPPTLFTRTGFRFHRAELRKACPACGPAVSCQR